MGSDRQKEKYAVGMAGEHFVAAELIRRGVAASVTMGNSKRTDVVVMNAEGTRVAIVEVKSSPRREWVVGNMVPAPSKQSWVFVHIPPDGTSPRYFVLTAKDLYEILSPGDSAYSAQYQKKNGRPFTGKGVVKLKIADAEVSENKWEKILAQVS